MRPVRRREAVFGSSAHLLSVHLARRLAQLSSLHVLPTPTEKIIIAFRRTSRRPPPVSHIHARTRRPLELSSYCSRVARSPIVSQSEKGCEPMTPQCVPPFAHHRAAAS